MEDPQTRVWTTQKEKNDHTGEIEQALPWAGLPGGTNGKKNLPANVGGPRDMGFDPWVRKIPWRKAWKPTPVVLPGESQRQRSLEGYSP